MGTYDDEIAWRVQRIMQNENVIADLLRQLVTAIDGDAENLRFKEIELRQENIILRREISNFDKLRLQ